jgi:hypothetical protein
MTSATRYRIGKVISVTGDQIFVSLADYDAAEPPSGVPASMTVDLPSSAGPTPLLIGQPGTFVLTSLPAGYLLCMVIGIEMKEERISAGELKQANREEMLLTDRIARNLSTVPVGTIDASGAFERGTDTMPTVNAPVFAVDADLIDSVYAGYAEGDFSLGTLSLLPD